MPEREHQRGVAVNTVTPARDGKEIWLVLGGGGLVA
jgi:cytochrome bd-type quinol oxidase subunit 2